MGVLSQEGKKSDKKREVKKVGTPIAFGMS